MRELAGRYRVGEVLGEGGSSVVRYGFDTTLKRPVAIKIFDAAATEVLREARTAAGLSHPNIAQVYDYGEAGDGPYLVMEFVGGETLADRLAREGALRWRRAAEFAAETAGALAAAHAQCLVHRDINPRNIMLTADGVKVLDFGIAVKAGLGGDELWGSPSYLAPEQLRGEPTVPAADVYALGLVLFECLTGSRAWPGESIGDVLATRHGRPAPRLPRIAGLPREISRLYQACTADDPDERPSAAEVAEALRRVGAAPTVLPVRPRVQTTPASATPRRRSRRRTALAATGALVAVVLSVVGVQLANGTVTPGGREAEAAVEAPHQTTTITPTATSPSPSPSKTKPAAKKTRVRVPAHTEKPARTTPPSSAPATPSATPSTRPTTSPTTAPTTTPPIPDDDPEPTTEPTREPTTPAPTTPPAPTPPATTTAPIV
ncbi:protein kinase [Actinoplanes bogorensis]|uniref:non-specific serine/threonine protein kinase n=1 Tax=Paractinoplanes bogorensis TaxID=1610840 RepID=A0ABS5YYR4_9ACTN|nr:serine/threonine protein kinase [Actinoplanes bogorensis]MBU2667848.1 protein kinase [Actinoplanes bogorensis]